jgi:hypothetical protein
VFPEQLITTYDVSRDGWIVAAIPEANGTSRLWLASLDGTQQPRPIQGIDGDNPRFAGSGEIVYRASKGNPYSMSRVRQDGTGRQSIADAPGYSYGNGSPDGQWLSVWGFSSATQDPGSLMIYSTQGGPPVLFARALTGSRLRWSPDGRLLYCSLQTGDAAAFAVGRTYVIPLPRGAMLPRIPSGGFQTEADLQSIPGVQMLPYTDVAPGPTAETYAFSRLSIARNLYRIPLQGP